MLYPPLSAMEDDDGDIEYCAISISLSAMGEDGDIEYCAISSSVCYGWWWWYGILCYIRP